MTLATPGVQPHHVRLGMRSIIVVLTRVLRSSYQPIGDLRVMTVLRLALAACSFAFFTTSAAAEPTKYPLTLENCGETITFQKAPATTATIGQAATEVLYALGLGGRVTGTSVWFNEVLPEFKDINAKVERLADNDPSFERVVAKRPELVAVQFIWHVGPDGIVATRTQFHDVGIPTYVLPADCVAKDNTVGVDGTRSELFSTSIIHEGIRELATVFDVQNKGEELVADLTTREAAAIERAKSLKLDNASMVFWFSSAEMEIDPCGRPQGRAGLHDGQAWHSQRDRVRRGVAGRGLGDDRHGQPDHNRDREDGSPALPGRRLREEAGIPEDRSGREPDGRG
jgi:ABC-type hemin transport system substrate-binding protein